MKNPTFETFNKMTANASENYNRPLFLNKIGSELRHSQRLKQNGFKLRVSEAVIAYKTWSRTEREFYSLTSYAKNILKFPPMLIRTLTLIDRDSEFIINRLFHLVFKKFRTVGLLPFDTNSHSSKRNSILGILRCELKQKVAGPPNLEELDEIPAPRKFDSFM
jgi:methyltransferase-like protein